MEICTTRGAVSAPSFPLSSSRCFNPPTTSYLRFPLQKISHFPETASYTSKSTCLRATSDESSSSFMEKKSDVTAILEDAVTSASVDKASVNSVNANKEVEYTESKQVVQSFEVNESSDDAFLQPLKEFLKNYNIELVEDSPTILLYGGGALLAVWLLSAIVGAIDSIPVFPKLMEVVGLGYSVWFTTRYLLFKKSREELGSKIEELKQEVLGSSDK